MIYKCCICKKKMGPMENNFMTIGGKIYWICKKESCIKKAPELWKNLCKKYKKEVK